MNREDQAPKASGSYVASRIFNVRPLACHTGASLSRMTATLPGDPQCFINVRTPPVPVCFAVSTSASSFYLIRIVPWQGHPEPHLRIAEGGQCALAVPHYSPYSPSHLNVGGEWLQFRFRVGILPALPCI